MDEDFFLEDPEGYDFLSPEDQMWDYGSPEIERIPLKKLVDQCARPVLFAGSLNLVFLLLGFCVLQRFIISLYFLPSMVSYATSCLFGSLLLVKMMGMTLFGHFCILLGMCIPLLELRKWGSSRFTGGYLVSVICLFHAMFCQCLLMDEASFIQFRGPLMIVMMKLISVGFDCDTAAAEESKSELNLFHVVCYCLDCSTVVFGPWISFDRYTKVQESKTFIGLWSVCRCVLTFLLAVVCLLHSQCFINWLIPDEYEYFSKWLVAYRTASSFRFSHYFVSFVSETTVFIVGSGVLDSDYAVSRPLNNEIPRSLVDVVINWNKPMHEWLKTYVFGKAKVYGNAVAVFSAYAASSLLHGLNFQISAVLLSLGFYTYIEHILREKLARIYSCCMRSKSCQDKCDHRCGKLHPTTVVFNVAFVCLAIFHLTYVGMVFNDDPDEAERGYSWRHTLSSWSDLNFMSHYVAAGMLVFAKSI